MTPKIFLIYMLGIAVFTYVESLLIVIILLPHAGKKGRNIGEQETMLAIKRVGAMFAIINGAIFLFFYLLIAKYI